MGDAPSEPSEVRVVVSLPEGRADDQEGERGGEKGILVLSSAILKSR
jgi:hypothetical protein